MGEEPAKNEQRSYHTNLFLFIQLIELSKHQYKEFNLPEQLLAKHKLQGKKKRHVYSHSRITRVFSLCQVINNPICIINHKT